MLSDDLKKWICVIVGLLGEEDSSYLDFYWSVRLLHLRILEASYFML
jgi:hypothetical protein